MDIFRLVALGIVLALLLLLIRKERPEMALGLSIIAGIVFFMAIIPEIARVITTFSNMAVEAGVGPVYFGIILKVLAIGYVADFAASICRDAGEDLMAQRVETAGRVLILVTSLPVIQGVLDIVRSLLAS